jgi:hypothetical protein
VGDWRDEALELERRIAAHPCSWCGRTRAELPADAQHMALLIDGQNDRAEVACDECLAEVAAGVLERFKAKRQVEPPDVM